MTRTLESLITETNSIFPGGSVLTHFQRGSANVRPIQLLAQFLIAELRDLYDSRSSDQANLMHIVANLDMALAQLGEVTQYFRELHEEVPL